MTDKEALKLALEALEQWYFGCGAGSASHDDAVAAIKEALAQPQQEPDLAEAFRTELDKLSQRNYKLRMENAGLKAQPQQEPVAWTLTKELEKRETTTRAHLWFSDPVNCMWSPLYTYPPQRTWVRLMRGVRVEGDTVVIAVKGGNDAARELCGELVSEMGVQNGA